MLKLNRKCKIGQHPELSGAVPHPSTEFYRVKTVPGVIKSPLRPFCATTAANSMQLRA